MVNYWLIEINQSYQISNVTLSMHERINDQLLVGVCFGKSQYSLLVAPYDYKYIVNIGL